MNSIPSTPGGPVRADLAVAVTELDFAKAAGMHLVRPDDASGRRALDESYTMIALGLDNVFLQEGARAALRAAGRE